MGAYGGGQYELGVGRGQIQYLAALFHPNAPNDIAPGGYDALDPEPGLPESPLDPRPRAHRLPPAVVDSRTAMPPKPRQVRWSRSRALAAMQQLETRSDEELEAETRFKAAAQAILGTRAAERMDAEALARALPRRDRRRAPAGAPAAAADGRGLAGARRAPRGRPEGRDREARPDAADQPPAADAARDGRASRRRQAPASPRRIGGILLVILAIVPLLALGWGIVKLIALPFGGIGTRRLGLLGLPAGRRRARRAGLRRAPAPEARARAKAAEQRAAAYGGTPLAHTLTSVASRVPPR